jgi:hypothetical protein
MSVRPNSGGLYITGPRVSEVERAGQPVPMVVVPVCEYKMIEFNIFRLTKKPNEFFYAQIHPSARLKNSVKNYTSKSLWIYASANPFTHSSDVVVLKKFFSLLNTLNDHSQEQEPTGRDRSSCSITSMNRFQKFHRLD